MRSPSKEKENHEQKSTARNKHSMFGNNEQICLAESRVYVEELWEIYVMWIRVTPEKVWIIKNFWAEDITDIPVFKKYTSENKLA